MVTLTAPITIEGLDQGVAAGGDQQPGADPVRGPAERLGQAAAREDAQDRHGGLERPEDDADAQPGPGVHPADPDADAGGEVVQAERGRHQQQGHHRAAAVRP
jgi:hypothetical protein